MDERASLSDVDLLGSASPGTLLAMAATALVGRGAADMATAQSVRRRDGALVLVAPVGFGPAFAEHFAVVEGATTVCGRALAAGEAVVVSDVATDPSFADTTSRERMLEAGSMACASFLVRDGRDEAVGVVSAHWRCSGPVDLTPARGVVERVQQLMSTAVACHDDPGLEAAGLRAALVNRDVIGVAKGILMAKSGMTESEAFATLSRASLRENVLLRVLARRIVAAHDQRAIDNATPAQPSHDTTADPRVPGRRRG